MEDWIKRFFDGAKELGTLEASAIWALFCMALGAMIVYDKREASRKDALDRGVRESKAIVEVKTADALAKLGNAYERLADTTKAQIDIILMRGPK